MKWKNQSTGGIQPYRRFMENYLFLGKLIDVDEAIANLISLEEERQKRKLIMIAVNPLLRNPSVSHSVLSFRTFMRKATRTKLHAK